MCVMWRCRRYLSVRDLELSFVQARERKNASLRLQEEQAEEEQAEEEEPEEEQAEEEEEKSESDEDSEADAVIKHKPRSQKKQAKQVDRQTDSQQVSERLSVHSQSTGHSVPSSQSISFLFQSAHSGQSQCPLALRQCLWPFVSALGPSSVPFVGQCTLVS